MLLVLKRILKRSPVKNPLVWKHTWKMPLVTSLTQGPISESWRSIAFGQYKYDILGWFVNSSWFLGDWWTNSFMKFQGSWGVAARSLKDSSRIPSIPKCNIISEYEVFPKDIHSASLLIPWWIRNDFQEDTWPLWVLLFLKGFICCLAMSHALLQHITKMCKTIDINNK